MVEGIEQSFHVPAALAVDKDAPVRVVFQERLDEGHALWC